MGRTLALLLARERLRVALVAPPQPRSLQQKDVRAYALNASSRAVLQSLRCWPDDEDATPVVGMQVFGDLDGQIQFDAASQEVPALAWIVDVPALEQRLAEAVRYQPQVEIVKEPVEAALTAVCEGRSSSTRTEFGVEFSVTPYSQHAIATRLSCELAHGGIARQWFTPEGILAFLPMGGPDGHEVAVVWSLEQSLVPDWLESDEESFTTRLQSISQDALVQSLKTLAHCRLRMQQLRARAEKLSRTLEERKLIDRAKGQLMKRHGLDEEAAFAALRSSAMQHGISLGELARRLLLQLSD